ncbi:hypothetical protein AB6A40_011783 [Gnathostoma spinigerum]|uniref:Uncharacterized protein n=1 Tax=Gnathostoma spinigerum TaxID=75299 RepID=A0ABD6F2F7_9BILA
MALKVAHIKHHSKSVKIDVPTETVVYGSLLKKNGIRALLAKYKRQSVGQNRQRVRGSYWVFLSRITPWKYHDLPSSNLSCALPAAMKYWSWEITMKAVHISCFHLSASAEINNDDTIEVVG